MPAAEEASLVTTDWVVQEAWRRIRLGLKRPELLPILDALFAETTVMPVVGKATFSRNNDEEIADALRLAVEAKTKRQRWLLCLS